MGSYQLIHFIHFLSDSPQLVWMGSNTSLTHTAYTGAPQGCVLSLFLHHTLYTNDCTSTSPTITYLKYSDDKALLAFLMDKTPLRAIMTRSHSSPAGVRITTWTTCLPTLKSVKIICSLKYLGIAPDHKTNFEQHTTNIHKRIHQRLPAIWIHIAHFQPATLPSVCSKPAVATSASSHSAS